ncbi:roadblock/LC7 domain-containing protein [Microbispora sp. RL4-1S]|uniref:Roadblock/LC7 domain-containing protein n=2 Tax=Microbispora oryzae TaxID=2806554 RepID=A0A941ANX2_9ACTN|nr:roadblock/LC7 domain-containing protein [Microbispora oryzae]
MDLRHDVHEELVRLRLRTPEIVGVLACTVDGMLVTTDLPEGTEQTAALTSALLSMSRRMAGLARIGALEETLISATHGHAACYAAGPKLVLTVLAGHGANLGLLRIEGRKTAATLAAIVERGTEKST